MSLCAKKVGRVTMIMNENANILEASSSDIKCFLVDGSCDALFV